MAIYRVDDGAIYYFDAKDHADALSKWRVMYAEECGNPDDEDEPEILLVQKTEAAGIKVTQDGELMPCPDCNECPTCGGRGEVTAEITLLEAWQQNRALPEERRAHNGALCCSEWP